MTARSRFLGASLAVGLILLGISGRDARADLFDLNSENVSFTGGPPFASVAVTSPGTGQIQFVVTALTSSTALVGELGFNTSVSLTGVTYAGFGNGSSSSFITGNVSGTGGTMDGFGSFTAILGGADVTDRFHSITYVLSGLSSTTLSAFEVANASGNLFAAHYFQGTLTGFVSGGTPVAVPEPSTLAIAGLGALGFMGYGLRRRLKK
jgi:hypothetical protein